MRKNTWLSFLGKSDEFIKLLTSVYQLGDDSTSIGGEKQAGISGGSQSPS